MFFYCFPCCYTALIGHAVAPQFFIFIISIEKAREKEPEGSFSMHSFFLYPVFTVYNKKCVRNTLAAMPAIVATIAPGKVHLVFFICTLMVYIVMV